MSLFKDSIKSAMSEYLEELKLKLDGLTDPELRWQAGLESNTIIWLVWHMARVEDNWINGVVAGNKLETKVFNIAVREQYCLGFRRMVGEDRDRRRR